MKKLILGISLLASLSSIAQDKYVPAIKQGSKLGYEASMGGQIFSVSFTFDSVSTSYLKIGWNVDGYGNGSWIMKNKSLENAVKGFWGQPSPGTAEEVPEDQIIMVLSQTQWNQLQKDKKFEFDNQTYTVKTPTDQQQLKLAGKPVDGYFVESGNGATRLWVLNNAALPLLLKIEGNSLGADLTLTTVE